MTPSLRPANHPPVRSGRIGVLIVNLGTPEGTDYWSMRRYLKEFLSDRRVIEAPRAVWLPILELILLRRPSARGRDYASIWNKERDEGPLKTITRSQCEKLGAALADLGPGIEVDWAMRYGQPPIAERMNALQGKRLRPHSGRAALSAILRREHRDGRGQGRRRAEGHALATGDPDRRAVVRRSCLYRRARPLDAGWPGKTRFRAGSRARLLSRHPRRPISTRATPITATAPKRPVFSARRSAGVRTGSR